MKILKLVFRISLVTVALVFLTIFFLAQPTWSSNENFPFDVKAADLKRHVKKLSEEFVPRDSNHSKNLDRVASYIAYEFRAIGLKPSFQPFDINKGKYQNVIVELGPNSEERIVVGAHYDAYGELPGADDNASGIAGLIEMARILSREKLSTKIELVAYTLEEPPYFRTGYMGSAIHASKLLEERKKVRAMLSLEMIGYFSDESGSQKFPNPLLKLFYPSRGNFIAVIGDLGNFSLARRVKSAMKSKELPVYSLNAPTALSGIDFSDHLNYLTHFPAVMITDTAFLRNHAYHTEKDTADRLDYDRMAKVVKATANAVLVLSNTQ